jgi:Mycolic acid cyclopropane synthetase
VPRLSRGSTLRACATSRPSTASLVQFFKFVLTEIFPGGWTPTIEMVEEHSAKAGFTLTRRQSLQPHYARTLDLWAEALEAHKSGAIEIQSEEVYERYMKYLTGCAEAFRIGYIDVNQFTLEKVVTTPAGQVGRCHERVTSRAWTPANTGERQRLKSAVRLAETGHQRT